MKDALDSILAQTYKNIEIIVCDDASTDNSPTIIENFLKRFPEINFIRQSENIGNCKLFNKAFHLSKGEFIIDLAADDLLLPDRVAKGVEHFLKASKKVGVQYCHVRSIDKSGNTLSTNKPLKEGIKGSIYVELITDYLVNPAGMMIKRAVLDQLNGYDEQLTYEDFDFWIRSSREFEYDFIDEMLVKKRKLHNSLSSRQFKIFNKHGKSTLAVCQKIYSLNKNKTEDIALSQRINYEMRLSIKTLNLHFLHDYFQLLKKVKKRIQSN